MSEYSQLYSFADDVIGYMVNTELAVETQRRVGALQRLLAERFPDSLWLAPPESLHVTLFDWLAPLVDYGQDKDQLFSSIRQEYETAMRQVLAGASPIPVTFTEVITFPNAIIIRGQDDGSYGRIRQSFVKQVSLLPDTKQPPAIVHCSIARFKKQIELGAVHQFTNDLPCNIHHTSDHFRLVRETKDPMLEYEVVDMYSLPRR